MKTRRLLRLPAHKAEREVVRLICYLDEVICEYECHESGQERIGGIRFIGVIGIRVKAIGSSERLDDECLGALCEVLDSDWVRSEVAADVGGARSPGRRHFAMYFESYGFCEVMASSFHELTLRPGTLSWK